MNKSIFLSLVLFLICFVGYSQSPFVFTYERTYPAANEDHFALDLDTLSGGNFISLAIEKNADEELKRINVTSYDSKGSLSWTKTYEYMRDYELLPVGDIILTEDDSLAFSVAFDTTAYNRAITKIGRDGGYGWTKLYHTDGQEDGNFTGRAELFNVLDEGYFHITDLTSSDGSSDLLVSKVDPSGEFVVSKTIDALSSDGSSFSDQIVDAQFSLDEGVLILSNTESHFVLTKMNRFADVIWMKSYESPLDNSTNSRAQNFEELLNGDIAIIAITTLVDGSENHCILQVSDEGDIKVVYNFSALNQILSLDEIESFEDTTIVFSGFRSNVPNVYQPFMAHLGADSTIVWSSSYRPSLKRDINGLAATVENSVGMFVTGGSFQNQQLETPYLIRVDEGGTTLCNQDMEIQVNFGSYVSSDLQFDEQVVVGLTDTISATEEDYDGFNPPILMLQDTTYCPQDPINYTIDATIRGGFGYLWSGNTPNPFGPIVTVTEEGEYSVTVTINEDVCFSLCDTATVSRRQFPMVQIIPNLVQYCETGEAILNAGSNNPIVEIEWSTGVTNETRIGVTDPGTYSVTIVDDCGNSAQGSLSLSESDFDFELPLTAILDDSGLCQDGMIGINLVDFNADPAALSWSNGATGVISIRVSEPGTYSVTFDGFCPGFAEITVSENDFLEEASLSINQECGTEVVLLIASGNAIERLSWSTGATNSAISVTESGTYTVTGFDICGDALTAEIEVTQEDLTNCGVPPTASGEPCLEFPNAFVPESREAVNKFFAPKNDCGDLDDYELRIYNRWGAEIFKSVRVDDGWDGKKGNSNAPADVYFFYSVYGTGGVTFEEKGDLLLIR